MASLLSNEATSLVEDNPFEEEKPTGMHEQNDEFMWQHDKCRL